MGSVSRRGTVAVWMLAIGALAVPAMAEAKLEAKITRNKQGIPTIEADSYKDLGFGYGYAFAEDNICVIADTYLTVERRALASGSAPTPRRPRASRNLDSDLFYQRIKDNGTVAEIYGRKPPTGPKPEVKQAVTGYVKGYNAYLKKTGVANLPDPTCAGQPWVRPITKQDVYQRFYELTLYASAGISIDGIANAQPPAAAPRPASGSADDVPSAAEVAELGEALDDTSELGSNAWGLGSRRHLDGRRHGARATRTSRGRGRGASISRTW